MSNPSARHELVCTIVQRYPDAVVALAEAVGVVLPEHDQVVAAPDAHRLRDGSTVHTDASVRLLRGGRPVFFATVEMQRKYAKGKYATLHAYHGSGVRNVNAGGHLFLLSDRSAEAVEFRSEDAARRAELAFAGSFCSGEDLAALRDAQRLSLGARALPAALADLGEGMPDWARKVLDEMFASDLTLADLYVRAMVEEDPKMSTVGVLLRPEMLERLRQLESFREYEAKVKAEADAEAEAKVEAKVEARVEAKVEARVEAKVEAAVTQTEAATIADNLTEFLILRGDAPSEHALKAINVSRDAVLLGAWLKRAYLGETSAQLFPEPKASAG